MVGATYENIMMVEGEMDGFPAGLAGSDEGRTRSH